MGWRFESSYLHIRRVAFMGTNGLENRSTLKGGGSIPAFSAIESTWDVGFPHQFAKLTTSQGSKSSILLLSAHCTDGKLAKSADCKSVVLGLCRFDSYLCNQNTLLKIWKCEIHSLLLYYEKRSYTF